MNREEGYYWVCHDGIWTIAAYIGNERWFFCGNEEDIFTHEIDVINETKILPPNLIL